ncbi:IS4 family transposase [Pedobacter aquatilis]|uniref:IS4 family transposase n=1 Tax=Pedobacter aquatilis TaxID=351343 RepID=UPI00292EAB94|nr:IS4 family transposase [Pedobacter aquatilis]
MEAYRVPTSYFYFCFMFGTDYSKLFNDLRLSRRGESLLNKLRQDPSTSIQSLASCRAEQKAFYRFLNSSKVKEELLSSEMGFRCGKAVRGKVVLCIQDTSEINLANHSNRLKASSGVGPIDAVKKGIGFKVHPCLVVDAYTCFPYGYAGIDLFNRTGVKLVTGYERSKMSVKDKESAKWLRGNQRAGNYLKDAASVIIIQDREGDIFEQFTPGALADNSFLIVRSQYDRILTSEGRLLAAVAQEPCKGTYTIQVDRDSHKKTATREAQIEVRYKKVQFKRPDRRPKDVPEISADVFVIEAREITENIEDPIHWRLTTTLPVNTVEDARQVIEWYTCRWMIEEFFRVLKKECYDIESSELEQGWAIRKLTLLIMDTILKLFQMHIAYSMEEGESPISSSIAFSDTELECLTVVNARLQGKTQLLSNPKQISELRGATWVIARLGGWKGYSSQRKPGATTLILGLQKFYNIYLGFEIQKDVGTR